MSRTKMLLSVIFMAILVLAELAYWGHHLVGNNAHKDFLSGIFMVFLGLLGLLHWVCICHCVVDDADNDHHHDHGTSNDDHVIITIKELARVNPSVLRSIPVVDFNSRNFGDAFECVVCLSELAEGDKAKVLPSCSHWFHAHCIDAWLQWHATCPICRKRVSLFHINKPTSELSRFSSLVETPAVSTP